MRIASLTSPAVGLLVALGCSARSRAPHAGGEAGTDCETGRQELVSLLKRLPDRAVASSVQVPLPEAALGGALGSGPVLEVDHAFAKLDGKALTGTTTGERAASLGRLVPTLTDQLSKTASNASTRGALTLYVAAAGDVDVRTLRQYLEVLPPTIELRLLFTAPSLAVSSDAEQDAHELAARLLAERDPSARRELARQGYRRFADCEGVHQAVDAADEAGSDERWPKLRSGLLQAVQQCSCDSLDAGSLKHLVAAEQRAGAMAFGSLPLSFLRDRRCEASMPLRSMQKLLKQVEDFDAEFAGDWQNDALSFERVITDERLLNYFCDALPGETLAALQRAKKTVYWRVSASAKCEGWRFKPLSPGTPMGTWQRSETTEKAPLALHYWQGAEEIRLYGPQVGDSKPTDKGPWQCDQNLRMTGVDAQGITLEQGRWYFEETDCSNAPPTLGLLPGCVGGLVAGDPPGSSVDQEQAASTDSTSKP